MKPEKEYLGDAVYVKFNEAKQLELTVENGISVTERIFLEIEVFAALINYAARCGWRIK
jgi:hypothetical protein